MPSHFNLKEHQRRDLTSLVSLGPERLDEIRVAIERSQEAPLTPSEIESIIDPTLKDLEVTGEIVTRVLVSMAITCRTARISTAELMDRLQASITSESAKGYEAEWSKARKHIESLIDLAPIRRVAKALDLSYDHENLLSSTRILCDVRPVFSDDDAEISGAVVMQTLSLEYRRNGRTMTLSLAVDSEDIEKLSAECERARKKAFSARRKMDACHITSFIVGEEKGNEK